MFSNLRNSIKVCRPCATASSRLLARTARLFSSVDVASLIGEPSSTIPQRPSIRKKLQSRVDHAPHSAPTSTSISEIPHWVKTPIDLSIFKAQNSNDLWSVAVKYQMNETQAVAFLASLAKISTLESGLDFKGISSSPNKPAFDAAVSSLFDDSGALKIGDTVLALKSLLALGMPEEDERLVRLRKEFLKDFFMLGRSTLISFAVFHSKYAEKSELAKRMQAEMEKQAFKRMKEVSEPGEILMSLSLVKRQDAITYKTIEGRLLELIPSFSGEEVARLLEILTSKHARSLPLLKAISNRYAHCEDDLPIKKLATLLSNLAVLHYPNLKILTVLLRDIEAKVSTIQKPSVAVGLFTSMAVMRLRCVQTLDALCQWTRQHLDAFDAHELASVLVALARCNFVPTATSDAGRADLLVEISKKLSRKKLEGEEQLWLDTVWALAVLERLSKEHVASVLDKAFYGELLKDLNGNDYKHLTTQLKLRNVNTAARLEVQGYKGPYLDVNALKDVQQVNVVQYKEESVKLLTDALNYRAPRDKYMKTNVTCAEGYVIDALLRVTADGKALPISQWEQPPMQSWPVAVMLRHFNDITMISDSPIGLHAMATRHLNALGYLVLEVPATELEQRRQPVARVEFLKEKIENAVHNAAISHSH